MDKFWKFHVKRAMSWITCPDRRCNAVSSPSVKPTHTQHTQHTHSAHSVRTKLRTKVFIRYNETLQSEYNWSLTQVQTDCTDYTTPVRKTQDLSSKSPHTIQCAGRCSGRGEVLKASTCQYRLPAGVDTGDLQLPVTV